MRSLVPLLLLTPSLAAAQLPAPPIPPQGAVLELRAEGRVTRVPDLATIRAGVVTQASGATAALAANAARMARVVAALRAAGIAERDLSTASVSLQPQYRYADGQSPALTGYQASNSLSVRFHDVTRAGKVIDALVAEGANQIDGPTLALADPDGALDAARADAVARARARALLYARAAGLAVDRIISISEAGEEAGGAPAPVMYRMRAEAAPAPTQMLPGETAITATLSVRFLLR